MITLLPRGKKGGGEESGKDCCLIESTAANLDHRVGTRLLDGVCALWWIATHINRMWVANNWNPAGTRKILRLQLVSVHLLCYFAHGPPNPLTT